MSTEHVNKINLKQVQSVDWTFEIEVGSNKVVGSIAYSDDFNNFLARAPALQSAHPDIPALLLHKLTAKRIDGDMVIVTLAYENNDPDAQYPGREKGKIKRYHAEPGAGEEPMLTNDIFKDLTDTEKQAALELVASGKSAEDFTKAEAKLTSEMGIKFVAKVRKGIEGFRAPGLVWVERFTTKDLADMELSKIFKTTDSPPGDCPDAGSERNWLRLQPTVNPHEDGKTFDLENRWELSLPGKWDPDFYPAGG